MNIVLTPPMAPLNLSHFVVLARVAVTSPGAALRILQEVQNGSPNAVIAACHLLVQYSGCSMAQAVSCVACMQGHNTHTG